MLLEMPVSVSDSSHSPMGTASRIIPEQSGFASAARALGIVPDKREAIEHFRAIARAITAPDPKAINNGIGAERDRLIAECREALEHRKATQLEIAKARMLINYAADVAMIEARNAIMPYNFMDFSRRMGERWEAFCQIPFDHPMREGVSRCDVLSFPALHGEMTARLDRAFGVADPLMSDMPPTYQEGVKIVDWLLQFTQVAGVDMGLDLHFRNGNAIYATDFKSGFGSREKGNTSRLLMVGHAYQLASQFYPSLEFHCMLLVRADEEGASSYLQTLKRSNYWEVYCGADAYDQIKEHTGIDLRAWIDQNISWEDDLEPATAAHLRSADLVKYLEW